MRPSRISAPNDAGLNTEVRHRGRVLHVQTEFVARPEPAVETRVYEGGAVLVRMKVACSVLADGAGLTARDVGHLVALQHENLIRKIRHGMVDDDGAPASVAPRPPAPAAVTHDPLELDDPEVRALLAELERRLDDAPERRR